MDNIFCFAAGIAIGCLLFNTWKGYKMEKSVYEKDDLIGKYRKALMIAADDMAASVNCSTCPLTSICESKYEYTGLTCNEMFIQEWEEEAGIE